MAPNSMIITHTITPAARSPEYLNFQHVPIGRLGYSRWCKFLHIFNNYYYANLM